MVASTISFVRVLIAVSIVAPTEFLLRLSGPIGILMGLTVAPAIVVWFYDRRQTSAMPDQQNPTEMKSALVFGVMYIGVLFALAAAKQFIGGRGLFLVAGISGLTEMDAITLSTSRMALIDHAVLTDGWRLIVVAAMANMVSKGAIAGLLGGWGLFRQIAILFAIPLAGGVAILILM